MKLEVGKCYFIKGGSPLKNQPIWTGTVVALTIDGSSAWIRYENGVQGQWYPVADLEIVQEIK